jgi:biotin carboxyl carrier protein
LTAPQTPDATRALEIGGVTYETRFTAKFERRTPYVAPDPHLFLCVIPGIIRTIAVKRGMRIRTGDPLMVLEAMKMQNVLVSPRDGIVRELRVAPGETVTRGQVLAELG